MSHVMIDGSKLEDMYSEGLYNEKNFNVGGEHTEKLADIGFMGAASLLNSTKSKENPVAFVIRKANNQFVVGAVVQFFDNEDASKPGNWNMSWTFYENDIPANAQIYDITDVRIHTYFRSIAGDKYGLEFKTSEGLIICVSYFFEMLKKWLDENAKEDEVVEIEQEGVFIARVGVENGVKEFALEAMGEIKKMIKDDAAIEK